MSTSPTISLSSFVGNNMTSDVINTTTVDFPPDPSYYGGGYDEDGYGGYVNATFGQTESESYTVINWNMIAFVVVWFIALGILTFLLVMTTCCCCCDNNNRRRRDNNKNNKNQQQQQDSSADNTGTGTASPEENAAGAFPEDDDEPIVVVGTAVEQAPTDVETAMFGSKVQQQQQEHNQEHQEQQPALVVVDTTSHQQDRGGRGRGSCCPYGSSITSVSIFTSFVALVLSIIVHSTCEFVSVDHYQYSSTYGRSPGVLAMGIWSLQYVYYCDDITGYCFGGDDTCYAYGSFYGRFAISEASPVHRIVRATSILATVVGGIMLLIFVAVFLCNNQTIKNLFGGGGGGGSTDNNDDDSGNRNNSSKTRRSRQLRKMLSRTIWIVTILQFSTLMLFVTKECKYGSGCGISLGSLSAITSTIYWCICGIALSVLPLTV